MIKNLRKPAVAGQFYPADASRLQTKIKEYLLKVETPQPPFIKGVKAIIVPHAGYDYSGPVAAYAYQPLTGRQYDNIILIGSSHRAYFEGLAIDGHDSWETPLGAVTVNKELAQKLAAAGKRINIDSTPHEAEHSLEVQLPFLQTVLKPGARIVPILFGAADEDDYEELAKILKDNLGENDLVVVSTDLSHYPSYENANAIDRQTLEIIKTEDVAQLDKYILDTENRQVENEDTLVCGAEGVKTVMALATLSGWDAEILHYANSGDAAISDKSRVVGYGAVLFTSVQSPKLKVQSDSKLNLDQQKALLNIARQSVEKFIIEGEVPEFEIDDERLGWNEGAFVTLKKNGRLRGCIGMIESSGEPLWKVIREMAIAAAAEDTRFTPVSADELPSLEYEISVLSQPETITDWRNIKLGEQGVIVAKGRRKGVFLPQVAKETGWSLEKFLSELCFQKAGLPENSYKNDPDVKIKVFTAQIF